MNDSRVWVVMAVVVLGAVLLYLLAPILTPFMISALLAYLGDPVVDRLEATGLSRTLGVVVVFVGLVLLALAAVLLLLPLLRDQITSLVKNLPVYLDWLRTQMAPVVEAVAGELHWPDTEALTGLVREHWQRAGGVAAGLLASVSRSGLALVGWLANLVLIPVVTFYLLRDWDKLVTRLGQLLPRRLEPDARRLAGEADEVLGAFLRGQLLVMIALGIIYSLGLWLVGLELAFLIGGLSGLVSFVPYLGFILGVLLAGTAAVVQTQELWLLIPVIAVFGVGQLLEGTVLTPLLVGDRIGLHPVAVIFAVMAGGQLFGFVGVLLALPAAAVIAVLLRHVHELYRDTELYKKERDADGLS